jgi:hypothetical protein
MTSTAATPTRPDDSAPVREADRSEWRLANPRRTRRA